VKTDAGERRTVSVRITVSLYQHARDKNTRSYIKRIEY